MICEHCGHQMKELFTSVYCDCTTTQEQMDLWDLATHATNPISTECAYCGSWKFYGQICYTCKN